MSLQPDIIWNEQCLGIRIGEQVCTYLKKHDAEVSSDRNIYGVESVNQPNGRRA